MRVLKTAFLAILILSGLSGCVTNRNLSWFNKNKELTKLNIAADSSGVYVLEKGDLVDIKVNSINQESVMSFKNLQTYPQVNPTAIYVNSYMIDDNGQINLPVIGKIEIAGKTLEEATNILEDELSKYYKFINVDIKLMNFFVTIVGEVENPGTFPVYRKKMNIFQLVAEAGGFTNYANLGKIRIIRTTADSTSVQEINMRDGNSLTNKTFFLAPDDVIYVESSRAKPLFVNARSLNVVLSSLTILTFAINSFLR